MFIKNGREFKFELNLQSEIEIAELCPGGDFSRIGEVFSSGEFKKQMNGIIKMAVALSKGYEDHCHYDDESYEPHYLSEDMFRFASMEEITELSKAVISCMNVDGKTEIETKEIKGKNAENLHE